MAIPQCALGCLVSAMGNSTCPSGDTNCLCHDQMYSSQASECITGACSIRDSLTTLNFTSTLCGDDHYAHYTYSPLAVVIFFTAFPLIAVLLRFLARRTQTAKIWWDDFCILVSMASLIAFSGLYIYDFQLGVGTHIWAIPFDTVTRIFMIFYVNFALYGIIRLCTRVSILLFYIRIFEHTRGHRARVAFLILDIVTVLSSIGVSLFSCVPVHLFWTRWDGEHYNEGHCQNLFGEIVGVGVKDIAFDVAIILLPLPWIAALNLTTKKKVKAFALLAVGIVIIIVSAFRLAVARKFVVSTDPTVDIMDFEILAHVEVALGIFCACLPSISPLLQVENLRKLLPFLAKRHQSLHGESDPESSLPKGARSENTLAASGAPSTRSKGSREVITLTHTTTVATSKDQAMAREDNYFPMRDAESGARSPWYEEPKNTAAVYVAQ
ncbi:hypothetical protein B0T19DRAFT_413393 [Cercophora scortea]|uniref:CFEM domain-containing protein n=1 Tax=Cercophora scortea TaxID=314031 RepID=A0AAE0MN25_9PEZI|nr:hypothetical protein B0T19DRAFT_413393 [Cercophora scortea]